MIALMFLCAFALSGIAAFYSIAGLVAIFSAAPIPIIVMGSALEASKLVTASWLYRNWNEIPKLMKTYFVIALIIIMMLTSMGIFGFLSKAHLDQAVPTGDVAAQVALIEENIKTEKGNVDASKQAIKQLDAQVDQVLSRSTTETGASRSASLRKSQQKERASLLADIQSSQKRIAVLNAEKAPIATQLRKVEAEVGPIKYIAALIYGDNPDENTLEKSVRWVIIMIVTVFDPLAVMMLIAANWSLLNRKKDAKDYVIESTPRNGDEAIVEQPATEDASEEGVAASQVVEEVQKEESPQETPSIPEPVEVEDGTISVDVGEHPVFKPEEEFWRSRPPSHLHR